MYAETFETSFKNIGYLWYYNWISFQKSYPWPHTEQVFSKSLIRLSAIIQSHWRSRPLWCKLRSWSCRVQNPIAHKSCFQPGPKPEEYNAVSSGTSKESKEGDYAHPNQGPPNSFRIHSSQIHSAIVIFFFFFTFPKFDLKGFYDSKCLKIFDMWDKAQTFNTEKMADRELPFCQCCLPLLLLFCINMQLEVHRKFVQFSGMIWRCLIFSFVHLLVHAGLICFVFILWHSFLLGVWECLNLKDNTNLFFKWIYQFILFQSIFKMSINPCALQYLV